MNPDEFWRYAMREAYKPLNAIEQAGLLDLVVAYAERGQRDLMWACVPSLCLDGATRMKPLTVARVENYARWYAKHGYSFESATEPAE